MLRLLLSCQLTGAALTYDETAAILSAVLQRPIAFERETADAARACFLEANVPAWQVQGMLDVIAAREHGDALVAKADPALFQTLAGRPPVRPAEWFHAAKAMFQ